MTPLPITNDQPLRNLLSQRHDGRGPVDISTSADWQRKRRALQATIKSHLGEPSALRPPTPGMEILETHEEADYRRLKVRYEVAAGESVSAWLLIPPVERRLQGAAVLCQHGTSAGVKDTQVYGAEKPGRDFARQLALAGFIALAPDHVCAGERLPEGDKPFDTASFYRRHPRWSAFGKTVHDGRRAVDILCELPEVDGGRIGTVGHSLGGYGAFFLAAFDERVRAAVSSCGLTSWQGNSRAANWAREEWYCHLTSLRATFRTGAPLPFDLYEVAALIAPRAFLNISGLADAMYGNNQTLGDIGLQLHGVWSVLGQPDAFANFLMGAGHDVPGYSQALIRAWFEHWLVTPRP